MTFHQVVAGLLVRDDRVLLVHRASTRRWYPDCWDVPGGHVDPGEAPRAALRRELDEELGVRATVSGAPLARLQGADFLMDVWRVDRWIGEPANLEPAEHDALGWFSADDLAGLSLADARYPALVEQGLDAARCQRVGLRSARPTNGKDQS